MTKRDLSYSKCRSISGSVPLPIEPKPIMTMGPVIFAWIFEVGIEATPKQDGRDQHGSARAIEDKG